MKSSLLLVAHRDQVLLRVIELALREMEQQWKLAHGGLDVIDQTLDRRPDAIVMGIDLLGLNGLDVARALRSLELTRRVPILFVAQNDDEAGKVAQASLAFVDWVTAPLQIPSFREQIQRLLRLNSHAHEESTPDHTLHIASIIDPLTGLYERHYLVHRLAYEAARAARYHLGLACVVIGIDGYDHAVQASGRVVVDEYISEVAKLIRREARATDIVGHAGRDKFLIIMPHTDTQGARQLAERVQILTRNPDSQIPFTLSVGIAATAGTNLTDNLTLLARAANVLVTTQQQGVNQIAVDWVGV